MSGVEPLEAVDGSEAGIADDDAHDEETIVMEGAAADEDRHSDAATEATTQIYPFYDVVANGGPSVQVRAGYVDEEGDIQTLLMDVAVSLQRAEQAETFVRGWYTDTLARIYQNAEDGDGQEANQ